MRPWILLVFGLKLLGCQSLVHAQSAELGLPVPAASLGLPPVLDHSAPKFISRGASPDPLVGDYSPPARLGAITDVRFGPTETNDFPGTPDVPNSTPEDRYNWGVPDHLAPRTKAPTSYTANNFGDVFNKDNYKWPSFESDHCFDDFISPMTNPFLAEDPRSLTELRPILMYQSIPHNSSAARGGNIEFFGLQGRLAINERFSIVLNKLGGMSINPSSGSTINNGTGLTEVWLGPKYTFYREDQTGTIAAAGLTFQLPIGSGRIYQDTGSLGLVPYITAAQRFGKTSWGTFNAMDTFGLSLGAGPARSNYFYNTFHIDFDVANWQRIYPLIEVNWFHYTRNGHGTNLGVEGEDLANIGSSIAGHNFMSIAIGSRFKYSESIQFGIAAEFPFVGTKDLNSFRLGVDMIWRY